ncbi:hypothetical protein SLS64_009426 [Diaporthe eres]
MSQKDPQIDAQEPHSSSGAPSKHECVDDSQVGRLTRLQPSHEMVYPSAFRFGMTIFALLIAVLCVALDSTIVSTAIPRITDEFHDLHDVGCLSSNEVAVTALVIAFVLRLPQKDSPMKNEGILRVLWGLDPLGFITFVPSIICLLLALEWGGTTYAWKSGQIISLFVVFGVTLIVFVGIQAWLGETATRSFFIVVYFLPIYFQAVKGASALQSGIDTIPLVVSQVLAIIMVGVLTSKIGYYMPFIYVSVIVSAVGSGLLITLSSNTSTAQWIGYQILYGFGSGCGFQVPQVAAQTVLPFKDIPTGIAITLFFQSLGGSIFVSVGNNVLNDRLARYIASLELPGVDADQVIQAGATAWHRVVPVQYIGAVTDAYNQALRQTFLIGLITACLGCIGAVFMEWESVKSRPKVPAANGDQNKTGAD